MALEVEFEWDNVLVVGARLFHLPKNKNTIKERFHINQYQFVAIIIVTLTLRMVFA